MVKKYSKTTREINFERQDNLLQEIWQKFTDVQEQMLRLRSVPISVMPESAKIVGKQLHLKADENDKIDNFVKEIASAFKMPLNEINVKDGYFYADVDYDLTDGQRSHLSEMAAANFIICPFLPVIDGVIFQRQNSAKFNFEENENIIRENFPSIKLKRDNRGKRLYFCQEYQTTEQGQRLKDIFKSELADLCRDDLEFEFYDIPENKEKYIIEIDTQSKKESQSSAVKELRGADFCAGDHNFGKLFKVNYPQMIFDISGDDFEKNKQLFESQKVNSIKPNLTGDLEKINRLKSSLNNILKGTNLQNFNLKEFIFDAEKAKKIEDIGFYINPQSDTFRDLENHLLNDKVNESQKQAIIKTLLAEDLALIQGPPGTGKSTAIAEIIWQHIRINPNERILLTSETNLAVDNAIDRVVNHNHNLVKPIRIGGEEKLEMEGRQFSLDVMKRWVENSNIEIDEHDQIDEEESLPQKLILQNWIDNICGRIDKSEMNESTFDLWLNYLSNPTRTIRQLFYDNYIKNCNVIGATCSSISKYSHILSDLLSEQYKKDINISTRFYKQYCEIFGKQISYTNKEGDYKTKREEIELVFTTVIQDESSKATPAELSLPLIYGKKNIIIGDHRQLPPMLDKEEFLLSLDFLLGRTDKEEEKKKIVELKSFVSKHFNEMEISHFQRLFEKIDDSLKGIFSLQYRMHPDINEVIKQFYIQDGGLNCGLITPIDLGVNNPDMNHFASRYHGIELEDDWVTKDNHVIWIDTNSPELLDATSRVNYGEVEAIKEVLTKLRKSKSFKQYQSFWKNPEDQQIGLISFYGKQIGLLKKLQSEFKDIPMRVSTVDRFQGMERNIIIVSMVRSNRLATHAKQKPDMKLYPEFGFPKQTSLGFAQSPNRLNVALSRAKRLLIIVGNSELFKQKYIYNNVYQTIANNPNGRIIKYNSFDYADKIETPIFNRSFNLNTRDIDTKNDLHLRNNETWLTKNKDNPKIAVLELSTKAVKLLIADQEKLMTQSFNFDLFIRDTQKTETGNGLDSNNRMDMNYFTSRVMPAISKRLEIIKQNNVDVIHCVATAAYRTASNRDEIVKTIQKQTGINVRILSKQEEAEATLWAYTFSTTNKDNFLKAKNIVMIDQGGGSTEISIFQDQKLVKSHSFEIGTTALKNMFFQKNKSISVVDALTQIDKESIVRIKKLLSKYNVEFNDNVAYCVCVGTAITEATPGKGNKGKHDKILTCESLLYSIDKFTNNLHNKFPNIGILEKKILADNDLERIVASRLGLPVILEIMKYFGINSLSVSGTGLWYGIFFKELYKIK
jgi:hypothetical protein